MKLYTVLLVVSLLGIAMNKTCGEGPAVASFEADITAQVENFATTHKSQWDAWKATSVVDITAGKVPKVCETLFAGKKTCCKADSLALFKNIYKSYINQYLKVGASFGSFGPKKGFKGDKLEKDVGNILFKCLFEYMAKHPELNTTSSASPSGNVTMEMTSSQKKIQKAMQNTEKRAQGLMKQAIAELGLMSMRLFRGTQCALCMDPDAILATIWDGGVLVKDSDVTAIKEKVKQGITDNIEGSKEKVKHLKASLTASLQMLECKEGLDLLNNFKVEDQFCKDDAGCVQAADAAVTSAWVVQNDGITSDNPTTLRVLQAASLKSSPTGLAGQTEDATEDADVKVDGKSATEYQAEAAAAETELKAEPLDVDAAIAAQGGADSSIMIFAFSLFIIIAGLMF